MQHNKKYKIKKYFKILLIIIVLMGIGRYLSTPYPYNFFFPEFYDEGDTLRSLGNFSTPIHYELKAVRKSNRGENVLAIYLDEQTRQKLIVTVLREHLLNNIERIQILDKTQVQRTFHMDVFENAQVVSFQFTYLLPLIFRKDDLSGMGDEAIVKGITIEVQKRFETDFADILYVKGEFKKIGLYKEKNGIWHYPTPVFDFKSIHDGALAFIKSKKSGKVFICVAASGLGKFHEKDFQFFLQNFQPS